MEWIKSYNNIWSHYKLKKLKELTGKSEVTLVGHLHSLWHFTLANAWRGGDLAPWSDLGVSKACRWYGDPTRLVKALNEAGFLDEYRVHDWNAIAGKIVNDRLSAESRRLSADQSQKPDARREEKRREEKRIDMLSDTLYKQCTDNGGVPIPTQTTAPTAAFTVFWSLYPKQRKADTALIAWEKLNPSPELFEKIILALIIAKKDQDWVKEEGKYVPLAANWIDEKRWEKINGNDNTTKPVRNFLL